MSKGTDPPEPQARGRPTGRTAVNPRRGRVSHTHRNVDVWGKPHYDVLESSVACATSRHPKEVGPSRQLREHHHALRDIEDAFVGRISQMRNVVTPIRSCANQ